MTTHFTSRFRRLIGVLAGLSLLASLLVAVPGPTKAQAGPAPDYLATFEACPEDIIPDAGFSDVLARNDNAGDIDCIAYYGITHGTSLTTYAPEDPVIREHMALFLIRLAKLVGIRVPSPGSTTRFTDVAHLTIESQDAISQLALLRITIGTNRAGTTYTPDRNVSRGEMALFLQRLMDLMDPVADGRDVYGYIPDDVDRNAGDFDVESPFNDLDDVSFEVYDAVTQLYELGVASGYEGSVRFYRPSEDMSRAAMAEFMAAILDHSNLRPEGVLVQMSPTEGLDDFDIVTMTSVRDASFVPREDEPVDWFYTDDPDGNGGLLNNGTCDDDLIIEGDCEWDEDDDDTTDRYGNIFEEFRATAGETMTFYAWVGRRNGDNFDDDTVDFSRAEANSNKGADSIRVEWEDRVVLPNATQIEDVYLVDLDRHSSLEFTIQLQDEDGNDLELEGVEIEVEVESIDIVVTASQVRSDEPDPDYEELRGDDDSSTTVITDRNGEATFELDAPRRDERLDEVIFSGADCCGSETVQIAWSTGDSVLVAAKPDFDLYQYRSSSNRVNFRVEYNLYDQYGNALRGTTSSQTGRDGPLKAKLAYYLYTLDGSGASSIGSEPAVDMAITRGRIVGTVDKIITPYEDNRDYFVLLKPSVFSDTNDSGDFDEGEISYVDPGVVVWIVERAVNGQELVTCDLEKINKDLDTVELRRVEVNTADREFRTCFTLWRYDRNDRFFSDGVAISIDEFGERLKTAALADISIALYSTRSSSPTIFRLP